MAEAKPKEPLSEARLLSALEKVLSGESRRIDFELNLFGQEREISVFRMSGFIRADIKPARKDTFKHGEQR